jgi:hypothetical protein
LELSEGCARVCVRMLGRLVLRCQQLLLRARVEPILVTLSKRQCVRPHAVALAELRHAVVHRSLHGFHRLKDPRLLTVNLN